MCQNTETTDLTGHLVEIAVIAPDGRVLFQSVINPQYKETIQNRVLVRLSLSTKQRWARKTTPPVLNSLKLILYLVR